MKKHAIIPIFIPHYGCTYNCIYCNQKALTGRPDREDYATVGETIEKWLTTLSGDCEVEVAFYGGSFTAIPEKSQRRYLSLVQPYLSNSLISGIRISTRPDAISLDNIMMLKEYGVKVIELGVQSLDPEVLKVSGRRYGVEEVFRSSEMIKKAGLKLGHQLMLGLPLSTYGKEIETASRVVEMKPDVVRIYPTLVVRGTQLEKLYREGSYQPLGLEDAVATGASLLIIFEKAGIKVIRMGVQPSSELLGNGEVIAGPFHPSYGEMVKSEVFRRQAHYLITEFVKGGAHRSVKLYVNHRELSQMIGHGRRNLYNLRNELELLQIDVVGLDLAEQGWVGISTVDRDYPERVLTRNEFIETANG